VTGGTVPGTETRQDDTERLLTELDREVIRQDAKHGPTFNAASELGRVRLGVACLEDEVEETRDAWREDRRTGDWSHTREEALQVAAVALRLVRQIDSFRGVSARGVSS